MPEEASAQFETQIKTWRASLTLLRRDLGQIYNVGSAIEKGDRTLISQFQVMARGVSAIRTEYMEEFKKFQALSISAGQEALFPTKDDLKQRNEVNNAYYQILEHQQKFFEQAGVTSQLVETSTFNQSLARSRLPKISLPVFSGVLIEWPRFKQLFESMIHNNSEIPQVEKFHYLSGALVGDPKTIIAPYPLDEANYSLAWEALNSKYDNQRLLATAYVEKVLEFGKAKGSSHVGFLQDFIRNVLENIKALKTIKIPNEADFLWVTIALSKLDSETRREFETSVVSKQWPDLADLVQFLQDKCRILQLSGSSPDTVSSNRSRVCYTKSTILTTTASDSRHNKPACCYCQNNHRLYECLKFRGLDLSERKNFVKRKNVCFNCLRVGHQATKCSSSGRCRTCKAKHHTMLHEPNSSPLESSDVPSSVTSAAATGSNSTGAAVVASVTGPAQVLLGTAEILIPDSCGVPQPVRMLVDCGSQFSLITASCAKRLGLQWHSTSHNLLGAGQTPLPKVKGQLRCHLLSRLQPETCLEAHPLVVSSITGDLPTMPVTPNITSQHHLYRLADPLYWKPRPIDFLLGNDLFMKILSTSIHSSDEGHECLTTSFGLIMMGTPDSCRAESSSLTCLCLTETPLSSALMSKFWETEEVPSPLDESFADPVEEHFKQTHFRDSTGRYVVSLPFRDNVGDLSESVALASARLRKLEFQLNKHPKLKAQYSEFMEDYKNLGHMSLTTAHSAYVIPHHAVYRSLAPESKIRVVFDASMKTSNGSLNDQLLTGPKLQHDITDIIINLRRYVYAVTVDLVKMYRQVLVAPRDRKFQHVFWRTLDGQLSKFELNTLTQGTAPAAYLAIRTLRQLVADEGQPYPLASRALLEESYVDDIISGANTLEEAVTLKNELIELLHKGCFEVHKWRSNSFEFMSQLSTEEERTTMSLSPKDSCSTKILGLSWDPLSDELYFSVSSVGKALTKRGILSLIARLYDPLGFLAPVVFKAKRILQEVWMAKLDWDDQVDPEIAQEWLRFSSQLHLLSELRINRFITFFPCQYAQILGFSDASEKGYAASLYFRAVSADGEIKISLLKSKTKLAPVKTLSIPKLELCGAHLLIKLLVSIERFLKSTQVDRILLFTDSTIVLAWLKISPRMLETFVANRVSYIVTHTTLDQWHHIASPENPADIASRGIFPEQLLNNPLWWAAAPRFSREPLEPLLTSAPCFEPSPDLPGVRAGVTLVVQSNDNWLLTWISQHSHYERMLRVLAYVMRFATQKHRPSVSGCRGELTPAEVKNSLLVCVKAIQKHHFCKDFCWKEGRALSRRLLTLAAFLDEEGVIRVGGRLQNSDLAFDTKFPILLPGDTHLTKILIDHVHRVHYHLGHQALQATIRRKFWIFRLRQTVRSRINKCAVCFRLTAKPCQPLMGNLPSTRVRPAKPFSTVGIDYAGPFNIKSGMRRNSPITKAYLAIFVCFSTKAVHLETVSALSTAAFLAAFDRFVARRGIIAQVYSDCGRNFVGAARQLKQLYLWLRQKSNQEALQRSATTKGIHWNFMPPYTPHFGGLWEAAVKSTKQHLIRILGDTPLTFEEMSTIFTRIEAILNSRPLFPLSGDHMHGDFLTPGHFLTGAPLTAVPEEDLSHLRLSHLSRWQLLRNSVQHFWRTWHSEYLHTLQPRPKWKKSLPEPAVGDLVLISDPSSTPLKWPTGRIVALHPGSDGITRVVSLKTSKGVIRRSLHRIVSLAQLTSSEE